MCQPYGLPLNRSGRGRDSKSTGPNNGSQLKNRTAAVGSAGISSDDPDAIPQLRRKLEALEREHTRDKAINRALRAGDDDALRALGLFDHTIAKLKEPDCFGHIGIAPFEFTNRSANMRRIRDRIAQLEANNRRPIADPIEGDGFTITEQPDDNRFWLTFDTKPDPAICQHLRRNGWKWSPQRKAWITTANNAGLYKARDIARHLAKQANTPTAI